MKYPIFGLLLLTVLNSIAQSRIEKYLTEIARLNSFSGSVAVAVNGTITVNKGYGLADQELGVPNSSNTAHRIGSLTKQFTSMAILKLIGDADSISVHDPVSKFLPEFPENWKGVTFFHLLTHTSGVPNYFGDLDAVPVEETYKEVEKVLEMEKANSRGLSSIPGKEFSYSNFGYVLLGRLIEVLSGKDYFDYLKESILSPLKMEQTFYDDPRLIIPNRSEGYKFLSGKLSNDALKDPAGYSAGGMLSSTEDMLKWMKALESDVILDSLTRKMMFTPYLENYGLGWQIMEKNGRKMYNHNGGTHGYNSRIVYYPRENVFIIVLGNNEDVRSAPITCDIEALIFEKEDAILSLAYSMEKASIDKFLGDFSNDTDEKRSIIRSDDSLFYVNGETKFEIRPLSDNSFCFSKYNEFRIEFSDEDTFTLSTCSVNPRVFVRDK